MLILLGATLSTVWGYEIPRHVNPDALTSENPFSSQLFGFYGEIFGAIVLGNYSNVQSLVHEVSNVYVPEGVLNSFLDYNDAILEIADKFKMTEHRIGDSWNFLSYLNENMAELSVGEALIFLEEANVSIGLLADSSVSFASLLKSNPASLLQGVEELRSLVNDFYLELSQVDEKIVEIELQKLLGLKETKIVLHVDDKSVLVGSKLDVGGVLSNQDEAMLGERVVNIFFEGEVVEVVTDIRGQFSASVYVPYRYNENSVLYSEFWPQGNDTGVLTPCISNEIDIFLEYYTPDLEVQAPSEGYPLDSVTLSGVASHQGNSVANLPISVRSFWEATSTVTDTFGRFEIDVTIPSDSPSGLREIVVESQPYFEYGASRVVRLLDVKRVPISVEVDEQAWAFSGGSSRISGSISVNQESLGNCLVELKGVDQVSSTQTLNDGSFVAYLEFPISKFSSKYDYTLSVTPREPWIDSYEFSGNIFVVNIVTLFGLPVFLGVMMFNYGGRILHRKEVVEEPALEEVDAPVSVGLLEKEGVEGIFVKALNFVSQLTNIPVSPSFTIREYLVSVRDRLGSRLYGVFERLSLLYEKWIYGRRVDEPPVSASESLLDEMMDDSEDES